ncbi:hypothetical protein PPSIR1_35047 [Plesiocystis pacifica SIR-1]|uniref:Uncharacterized protein n=1 Tax=Plesiocystis pacifica SIR-1 TaxID=391625 RepID=A6G3R7_9BACT|nr:HEAT repeat domain-containing protein [Plesiocystis pacifica]EDM79454.1 hypothetical protein PPSIR1_35047 [Plesiocystis pacifica SIR-1]
MNAAKPNSSSSARSEARNFANPRLVVGASVLALGLGVYGMSVLGSSDSSSEDGAGSERATLEAPRVKGTFAGSAGGSALPCSFEVGTQMGYDIHTQTRVEIDFGETVAEVQSSLSNQQQQGTRADIDADAAQIHEVEQDWHMDLVAVAAEDDGGTVFAARIRDRGMVAKTEEGGSKPEPSANLDDTFLIRVDGRCGVKEYGWRTEGDLEATRQQQILVGGLGFWAPRSLAKSNSYSGNNFDNTGRYDAVYEYDGEGKLKGTVRSFGQNPMRGSSARAVQFAPVEMTVVDSSIEAELAPGVWFESLSNFRDLELSFGDSPFGAHLRATTAKTGRFESFSPAVELDDGGWSWGIAPPARVDQSENFDPELVGVPMADVVDRYRELIEAGKGVGDYGAMLTEWLRANPGETGALVAMLEAGEFDGEDLARMGVFYALGNANTDAAKDGLTTLLRGESVRNQIAAAHAMSMVDSPRVEMLDIVVEGALDEAMHPIERGTMALALGAVAQHTATSDPAIAAQARETIHGWLDAPADDEQLGHALAAAGNAGHDEFGDAVGRYLDHESPKIRSTATKAMRQMSPEEAFPRLETPMVDEDRVVRTQAFETAATVARAGDAAPSEALVDLASSSLGAESQAERRAAMALIGEAAKRGSEDAGVILDDHLRAQLDRENVDPKALAAIGRNMGGRWVAKR